MSSLNSQSSLPQPPSLAPPLLAEDSFTQWKEVVPWSAFVHFWSNNSMNIERSYPYELDLQISPRVRNQAVALENISNMILVTQSYADLYERIKKGLLLDSFLPPSADNKITRQRPRRRGVIITGQPGTGTRITSRSTVAHY